VTKTTAFTLSVTLALTVATPTITPNGGNFSDSVSVAMQTATSGASIYYTMDGSTPTQSSIQYTGAMTLASDATVNAKAFKSGANPSAVASASFVKNSTGNTYYVATGGSDSSPGTISQPFRTIKKGVSVLKAGDTVYIRSGTYYENLDGNRDVIPSGTSWANPVTIAAYPGETVTMALPSPQATGVLNIANSPLNPNLQYIIFAGLIFDATNVIDAQSGVGIGFGSPPAHHIRLQNFEVKNTGNAAGGTGGQGVIVAGSFNEFINCNVHDNGLGTGGQGGPWLSGGYGFYIGGTDHLVERCKIHDNGGYGIHVYNSGPGGSQRQTIRYNEIYHNHQAVGISRSTAAIIVASGSDHKVYNNIVRNDYAGIQVYGSCSTCLIYNNTVYANANWGIQLDPGSANNIIRNNIIYQNPGGNISDWSGSNIISNNLMTDPRFANPAAADFHLQPSSPAIDAGTSLPDVGADFDGTLRPQGVAFDIGAYEYR